MSEENTYKLSDREMLAVVYGALKANPKTDAKFLSMLEKHLFPTIYIKKIDPGDTKEVLKELGYSDNCC